MFEAACQAFVRRLGIDAPLPAAPDLAAADFGKPLYLHMAALAAAKGRTITEAGELLDWVLQRERDAWDENLGELELSDTFAQAVTRATLWGGAPDQPGLREIAKAAPEAGDAADEHRKIALVVARLYPEPPGLGVLHPDILGEELVAEELVKDPHLLRAAFASDVPDERLRHAFTVLGRPAGRKEDTARRLDAALDLDPLRLAPHALPVAGEPGAPLAEALERLWERSPDGARLKLAARVAKHPLERTVPLRRFCAEVTRALYEAVREQDAGADPAMLAGLTNDLANFLSALGRPQEALEKAQEAAEIYRRLTEKNREAFEPDLAGSLNNLAIRLSALGRPQEALEKAQEAVRLLAPYFLRLPAAHGNRMAPLVRQYRELFETLGRKPDMDLLAPILFELAELEAGGSDSQPDDPA